VASESLQRMNPLKKAGPSLKRILDEDAFLDDENACLRFQSEK
jgi:hypothetical protein